MLLLAREVHHLRHLGFCDFIRIDTAFADPVLVHMKHDPCGVFAVFVEEPLQDLHDEFHRRVIVVQQQHAVEIGPLGLRLDAGDDGGALLVIAAAPVVSAGHARLNGISPDLPAEPPEPRHFPRSPVPLGLLLRRIAANLENIGQSPHSGQPGPADMVIFNDPARQALTLGLDRDAIARGNRRSRQGLSKGRALCSPQRAMERLVRAFSSLRRFFSDTKGNIAIIFTLAIVPVMGAMGIAVDYSLANASRTALQASLDNTGLMLAKMIPLNNIDLNGKGWQIFRANLGPSPLVFQQSDLVIAQTTSTLKLDITTTYNTQLASVLKLVGASTSFPVGAHAQISWGNSRLRVALVLDNTLSMLQSGKITALKTAATNLITQLQAAANVNGDVYVSIIPFVKNVNVGSSNYAANWIDSTGWKANNGSCSTNGSTQSTCQTAHCSNSQYKTKSTCQSHSATWYNEGTCTPKTFNSTNWNGCVTDRGVSGGPGTGADYDQNVNTPNPGVTASLFPDEQYSSCPLQMMGLSYDWTSLKNLVSLMSPNGS